MANPTPPVPAASPDAVDTVARDSAHRTLRVEIDGLNLLNAALDNGLSDPFGRAAKLIHERTAGRGRVIVSGMGKSGHVGSKIAATMASTGTPAFFVHPAEASHGDLGMITPDDVVLALSWSGETAELYNLVDYTRRFSVPLVALTSRADSTLGKAADICLELPRGEEACPHGLAPTTSTLMQLALGDALAIALLEMHGFSAQDFRVFHPGGQLGANLKFVRDAMHQGDALPVVKPGMKMGEAIVVMSQKSFGCVLVTMTDGQLAGIITDGDIRRHLEGDLLAQSVETVMTRQPSTIRPDSLVSEAMALMNRKKITALAVAEDGRLTGLLHMHDLLRIGVR
ncbi:MAG: KpsF/GutQ family sugar-phosphate isomerase [Hyphomicrobiaceae bacterium]|nr:KpsF/GutQ family sugar-phosphate isomerase [Hyphomicrobiaceae bacterium]